MPTMEDRLGERLDAQSIRLTMQQVEIDSLTGSLAALTEVAEEMARGLRRLLRDQPTRTQPALSDEESAALAWLVAAHRHVEE